MIAKRYTKDDLEILQIKPDPVVSIVNAKCDVICEKGPYCGRNIVGPDQMPRMMRGV